MELIIDKNNLFKLIKDFYTITGMKIVIFGPAFNPVLSYPLNHCVICERIRSTKIGDQRCINCDLQAQKFAKINRFEYYIYECHAGLTEAILPILEYNEPVGYIIIGQIISSKKSLEASWNTTLEKCSSYVLLNDLKKEYFTLPYLNVSQIEASAHIASACTSYISLKNYMTLKHDALLESIINFIEKNLSDDDLSTKKLTQHFFISRNRLFQLIKTATGMSLGDFIISKRLEYAKSLLESEEKSITEIAYLSGFCDSNYFTRIFKKKFGQTPSQFRKNFTNNK